MQKKKKYIVAASFWKDGILLSVGQDIWLFPSEAKYRGHALTDPDKAPVAAPAVADEQPATQVEVAPELTVEVTEVEPKPARGKRVKAAGAEDGNAE
jgi:hypothetical protein